MSREQSRAARWFRRSIQLILLLTVIGLLIGLWPKRSLEVRAVPVTRGAVESIVPSIQAGRVKAERRVTLRAISGGPIRALQVERGQRVDRGARLLELDSSGLAARLRLARANLDAGRSALRTARLRRDTALSALQRNQKMADRGALSPGALERFQAEHALAKEAVAAAEANVAQLQASVELAHKALEDARIRAPFAGLVTQVHVELGEVISPANPLLELVDDSRLTVAAPVDEADIGKLNTGMPVRIEADAFRGRSFAGELAYISPVVLEDMRQNRSLQVEVGLDGAAAQFKVGMSADIEIVTDRRQDVLWVPTAAVMRRADRRQVYVLNGDRAQLRDIQCGLTNWDRTEVREGLREGERVIISLEVDGLGDGVRVHPAGSATAGRAAY